MERCLELAAGGAGFVAPNPMVGAVLVYQNRIIGEGWHQHYGKAHAEVNCIASVKEEDRSIISQSTLYVSLEPCAHFGKTPPCADLIIQHQIPKVIIGCRDPFAEVNGKGIEKLKVAGVSIEVGVLEYECMELNKRFFTFHAKQRPYIILKWAQTADGFISTLAKNGNTVHSRLQISNEYCNRLVHKWRSEEASILVGTNTALLDDPELTTRLWQGPSPVRVVMDMDLKLPASLKIFNHEVKTIIFNTVKQEEQGNIIYCHIKKNISLLPQLLDGLYQFNIQSVMVEGGAKLLQSFIDEKYWDEARILTNSTMIINKGLAAPVLKNEKKTGKEQLFSDIIEIYKYQETD